MSISSIGARASVFFKRLRRGFLSLARWAQATIAVVAVIALGAILVLARGGPADTASTSLPTVTLQGIGSFGSNVNGVNVLGTVQSVSEAALLAQSGGSVQSVNTKLGASVPAGFVIASLDSAAASAAVLQAQGAYDAAVAAQKATDLQAGNTAASLAEAQTSVRNTYQSTYTSLASALTNDVDTLFGDNTPTGPELLVQPGTTGNSLSRGRRDITTLMNAWQASLGSVNVTDPITLLSTAQTDLATVTSFLSDLAAVANAQGSGATSAQLASLAAAQGAVDGLTAAISSARTGYNAAATAAAVGQTQASGGSSSAVTSSEASVEVALGGLRAAQAAYEKTVIRAPIAGTVNFLPISVGDYVTPNEHVATVAQNNTLEVVMQLSQGNANRLAVGDKVVIAGSYNGVVTTISPALDPTTKQVEARVAVDEGASLVNGQSVQVALPALPSDARFTDGSTASPSRAATSSASASTTAASMQVPLTAVKLLPDERDVFTVDATGRLVAHPVTIGDVVGNLIEILTPLDPSLQIVTDARGLSAGDAVLVASSTVAAP